MNTYRVFVDVDGEPKLTSQPFSLDASGNLLVEFSENLLEKPTYNKADYIVKTAGEQQDISSVSVTDNVLKLTMQSPIIDISSVAFKYNQHSTNDRQITDIVGNGFPTTSELSVYTSDVTFASVRLNKPGDNIIIEMNENIFIKDTYSKDHFELQAFRNIVEIESVTFSGNLISIEPKVTIESINSVIVKYNSPSDNNAKLKNIAGNLIQDNFTLIGAVDNTVPTFNFGESGIISEGNDAGKIRLKFSEHIGKKPNYVGTDFRLKFNRFIVREQMIM